MQQLLDRATAQADARLDAAGVDIEGQSIAVRGSLDDAGRLTGVHVVRSSGSRDLDYAVERALNRMSLGEIPPALIGANLTLPLGHGAAPQAHTP